MHWQKLKWASWMLGWMLLTASCASSPEPFMCTIKAAYDEAGAVDKDSYRVNRDCMRGMSARVKACYQEAK